MVNFSFIVIYILIFTHSRVPYTLKFVFLFLWLTWKLAGAFPHILLVISARRIETIAKCKNNIEHCCRCCYLSFLDVSTYKLVRQYCVLIAMVRFNPLLPMSTASRTRSAHHTRHDLRCQMPDKTESKIILL